MFWTSNYQDPVSEAFDDVRDDGNGGELELSDMTDEGDGDDTDRELQHRR